MILHCVNLDIVQLSKSRKGKQYPVVFIDYLTKWSEVFAVKNQDTLTIDKLLVEEIVSRKMSFKLILRNLLSAEYQES